MTFGKILGIFNNLLRSSQNSQQDTSGLQTIADGDVLHAPQVEASPEQVNEVNLFNIPQRGSDAMTGSEFISQNINLGGAKREANIVKEICNGNIPDFLKTFVPITSGIITYYVAPDYLSIGDNSDFVRMPMNPKSAKLIADQFGCALPTKKMVDDIYKNAAFKLNAKPFGPPYDHTMESTARFDWSNKQIQAQLTNMMVTSELGLVAGHKKDVVIGKPLLTRKNIVAIYGWFLNGKAIQGPFPNYSSHDASYADYSHGIRLISRQVKVNDKYMDIYKVLNEPTLASLITDDGPFNAENIYK